MPLQGDLRLVFVMDDSLEHSTIAEEELVAELALLGINYLSRQTPFLATCVRPPASLLADLVRQPSARVRAAVVALLLSHPEYAEALPAALQQLGPSERWLLQSFYTAAVLLQREHSEQLRALLSSRWQWLPDLYSTELGVPGSGAPRAKLAALGWIHRRRSGADVNWVGTYEQPVRQLLRCREKERQWNQ